jgi:flavin reductase (DIM6/NTAB) family NADH-FMN oxidoreductase RutF
MKKVKNGIYHLLHPKVTTLITSSGRDGRQNVCACAWASPVSMEPPLFMISLWKGHYTSELILETKEFVINIPTISMLQEIETAGSKSGRKFDKIKSSGLKFRKGNKVSAPVIQGCIGIIELKLNKVYDGGECYIFLGEVLEAYAEDHVYNKFWKDKSYIPLHLGGKDFALFSRVRREISLVTKNAGEFKIDLTFKSPETCLKIISALPINAKACLYGEEIYFNVPVTAVPKEDAKIAVEKGDVGFWLEEPCICLFFGKTPSSEGNECRAYSEVNVFGRIRQNLNLLKNIREGEDLILR